MPSPCDEAMEVCITNKRQAEDLFFGGTLQKKELLH